MKTIVLLIAGSKVRKKSNQASWDWFCRLLEPWPESHQIEPPGTGFLDFWSQGQKVIKSSLPGLLFSTSGIKARISSNPASWGLVSLGHLLVSLLSTHRASGGSTKNMCLHKNVSIRLCPPLSHHTLYCYLQSRYSTKRNVLML